MTPFWILILGLMHGAQPDHAIAAFGLSARTGMAAWRAAIRVALGHGVALVGMLVTARLIPRQMLLDFAPFADFAAGGSLLFLSLGLILQTWRGRFVLHRHDCEKGGTLHAHHREHAQSHHHHEHSHSRHRLSTLAFVLILGLGGARTLAVMMPVIMGKASAFTVVFLHTLGITIGAVAGAFILDLARHLARRWTAEGWIDLAGALGTAAIGLRMIFLAAV